MKIKIQSIKNYFKSKKEKGLTPIFFNKIGDQNSSREELKKNLIPVNFQLRKSEKLASEEKRLFIENRFRVSVGLKPYLNFQEFLDADPEELNEFSEKMVLEEAARILIDQINFNKPKRLSSSDFRWKFFLLM